MEKLSVGVIGCGRIGSLLERDPYRRKPCTHAGAFSACEGTALKCACDIDPDRLAQFRADWGVDRLYLDYREMLGKEKPEIVSIASWTSTHKDIVVEAANSGVKGILCEKPIALSLADADEMISECESNNVALMINHERRWDQRVLAAKKLIDDGTIGELRSIRGEMLCGVPDERSWKSDLSLVGGGPLLHDGTHLFDLIRYFAGDAVSIVGFVQKNTSLPIEDSATATLMLENGISANVEVGGRRAYFHFSVSFWGSNGMVAVGNGINDLWVGAESSSFDGFRELSRREFPLPETYKSSYLSMAEEMVDVINGSSTNRSTGEDGREALHIIWGIYESERQGNSSIDLPIEQKEISPLVDILNRQRLGRAF
ncbi:MAG: Gfo/Idh/MocA family oxidoreductase [Candidatus Coatesbacteria bacterium]|nr:Gfo/Idh/MocA family oxidoreductase [Candidatus Coatesbacteria bacterium]